MGLVATLLMLQLPAQDTVAEYVDAVPEQSLTTKQVYNDIKDGFSKLVSALEGPAKHTYTTYVKQYRIKGITNMIMFVPLFVVFAVLGLRFNKQAKWDNTESNELTYPEGMTVVFVVLFGITLIVFSIMLGGMITKIFNPEYHAIQDIISAFK